MLPHLVLFLTFALSPAQAADAWPDLSTPIRTSARDGAEDLALIIAIEDYDHSQDLPGALANGRAWRSYLKESQGVRTIKVLENASATREEILAAAKGIAERMTPGARLWVVYIGHGAPAALGEGGMLVGVDARQTASSLEARSVRLDELEAALDGPQADVVLVQDACFSGKASGGELAPGLAPLKAVSTRLGAKWTVLAAGRNDEYAGPLSDGSRPAFSYLVLGALRGWGDADRDGQVTAAEAVSYANDAIFETVTGRTQRPVFSGPDLVLGRSGGERAPELSSLQGVTSAPIVVPLVPLSPVGPAKVDLGGAVDFAALAAEAEAKKAAASAAEALRREADAAQHRLDEAVRQERRRRVDEAVARIKEEAARDFAAIEGLVKAPTPEAQPVLEAYLARYKGAEVEVDDLKEAVTLDEVRRVEAALGRMAAASRALRSPPPDVGKRVAVVSYTAAAALGAAGFAFLVDSQDRRSKVRAGLESGRLSEEEARAGAASSNQSLYLGYGGLGLGLALGLGAKFLWASSTASGDAMVGLEGDW
jgi:hypothetical protein